mgnify:CR=1 FL=1
MSMVDPPESVLVPQDALSFGQLSRLMEAEAAAKQRIKAELEPPARRVENAFVDKLLGGIADAISGVAPPGFQDVADAFEDGQAALVDRLDLLDGVRGYCQAYMSRNVNGEWGINNTRQLPFDAPLGPSKGAHVDAAKGGIVMDEPGLWTVSMLATGRATSYTASWLDTDSVRATVRVHRPDGSVFSQKTLQNLAGKSAVALTVSVPVTVDQPGYYVTVEAYASRWRWWDGGTRYSALAVVKHDNRVINPGADTVPDESR